MSKIKYPSFVMRVISYHVFPVVFEENNCSFVRNKLEIYLDNKNSTKTMIIIMMNPSDADDKLSDLTTNRVLNYARCKYKKVIVFNVLPFYSSQSKKISKKLQNICPGTIEKFLDTNIACIEENIKLVDETTDIFLATGYPSSDIKEIQDMFENQLQELYKILIHKDIQVFENTKGYISQKGTTYHPLYVKNGLLKESDKKLRFNNVIKLS